MKTIEIAEDTVEILRSTMDFRKEILKNRIEVYNKEVEEFEKKYNMTSDEFYKKFDSGELGDEEVWFKWIFLYETINTLRKEFNSLKNINL